MGIQSLQLSGRRACLPYRIATNKVHSCYVLDNDVSADATWFCMTTHNGPVEEHAIAARNRGLEGGYSTWVWTLPAPADCTCTRSMPIHLDRKMTEVVPVPILLPSEELVSRKNVTKQGSDITLEGSPPNAAILSWMNWRASRWSDRPAFKSSGATYELASYIICK